LIRRGAIAFLAALAFAGCRQDMHDQPKYEPFEESDFFADGQASRLPIEGTVARGQLRDDTLFYEGLTADGELAPAVPIELDAAALARGRDLYNAFCSPCHDQLGTGNGMIVQRGFKQPESFQSLRLRQSPPGYFYQVMTNGFAEMSSYAAQIEPSERWAIAAYIRALQLSQSVPADELSEFQRFKLPAKAAASSPGASATGGDQ
jgi:mono/diheme cytochrome c family protein